MNTIRKFDGVGPYSVGNMDLRSIFYMTLALVSVHVTGQCLCHWSVFVSLVSAHVTGQCLCY